ncbi:hypothetical protein BDD12DRAFT_807846 [Trichophaea hybrida]|nr:hypothetical protein BDD12DRAFT_807846 [Trichophaea hybrida]
MHPQLLHPRTTLQQSYADAKKATIIAILTTISVLALIIAIVHIYCRKPPSRPAVGLVVIKMRLSSHLLHPEMMVMDIDMGTKLLLHYHRWWFHPMRGRGLLEELAVTLKVRGIEGGRRIIITAINMGEFEGGEIVMEKMMRLGAALEEKVGMSQMMKGIQVVEGLIQECFPLVEWVTKLTEMATTVVDIREAIGKETGVEAGVTTEGVEGGEEDIQVAVAEKEEGGIQGAVAEEDIVEAVGEVVEAAAEKEEEEDIQEVVEATADVPASPLFQAQYLHTTNHTPTRPNPLALPCTITTITTTNVDEPDPARDPGDEPTQRPTTPITTSTHQPRQNYGNIDTSASSTLTETLPSHHNHHLHIYPQQEPDLDVSNTSESSPSPEPRTGQQEQIYPSSTSTSTTTGTHRNPEPHPGRLVDFSRAPSSFSSSTSSSSTETIRAQVSSGPRPPQPQPQQWLTISTNQLSRIIRSSSSSSNAGREYRRFRLGLARSSSSSVSSRGSTVRVVSPPPPPPPPHSPPIDYAKEEKQGGEEAHTPDTPIPNNIETTNSNNTSLSSDSIYSPPLGPLIRQILTPPPLLNTLPSSPFSPWSAIATPSNVSITTFIPIPSPQPQTNHDSDTSGVMLPGPLVLGSPWLASRNTDAKGNNSATTTTTTTTTETQMTVSVAAEAEANGTPIPADEPPTYAEPEVQADTQTPIETADALPEVVTPPPPYSSPNQPLPPQQEQEQGLRPLLPPAGGSYISPTVESVTDEQEIPRLGNGLVVSA